MWQSGKGGVKDAFFVVAFHSQIKMCLSGQSKCLLFLKNCSSLLPSKLQSTFERHVLALSNREMGAALYHLDMLLVEN